MNVKNTEYVGGCTGYWLRRNLTYLLLLMAISKPVSWSPGPLQQKYH